MVVADANTRIIFVMLIVALIFIGVIAIGETGHWLNSRRRGRH